MSDIADYAADLQEILNADAIAAHARRKSQRDELPKCAWCEEQDVEVLSNGARAKYCHDCAPDAIAAMGAVA